MTSPQLRFSPRRHVWLIARREVTTRTRSRPFLLSIGALLLLIFVGSLLAGVFENDGGLTRLHRVAATAETQTTLQGLPFDVSLVATDEAASEAVETGTVDFAVVGDSRSAAGYRLIVDKPLPPRLVQMFSIAPSVTVLRPVSERANYAQMVGIVFGVIFMWSAVTFGTTIAQSVVEEKQTRVIEILLATVSSRALFAGKILGTSVLALGAVVLALGSAYGGSCAAGQCFSVGDLGSAAAWFAVLFVSGFIMLAASYGACAALVTRQEDVPAATTPISLVVMAPYLLAVLFADNTEVLHVMSYVPLSAPVAMPMRLFLGTAGSWEPWLSLTLIVLSAVLVTGFGARVYRNSALQTGARASLRNAVRKIGHLDNAAPTEA